jgi:hypothetical protein
MRRFQVQFLQIGVPEIKKAANFGRSANLVIQMVLCKNYKVFFTRARLRSVRVYFALRNRLSGFE